MLAGRVDFEMLTIGSSPLPDVSFNVLTAQPLLLRKSDADVFLGRSQQLCDLPVPICGIQIVEDDKQAWMYYNKMHL